MQLLRNHALAEIQRIRDRAQRPIVILNNRVSSGANAQQSLPVTVVEEIRDTVRSQGYELFILSTSGDKINTHLDCPASAAFYAGGGAEAKYGKAYHLILLYELSQLDYIQGIIGGTSGTLDIAGFLGLRCFNIHEFANKERKRTGKSQKEAKKTIQSQEYRILIQNTWMTIMPTWSAYVRDSLVSWLHRSQNVYRLPLNRRLTSRTNHNDRHPFTCFNNEEVTACSKRKAFQPYQDMLDIVAKNQLASEQEPDDKPWYFGRFDLF